MLLSRRKTMAKLEMTFPTNLETGFCRSGTFPALDALGRLPVVVDDEGLRQKGGPYL
jgi:hypothetical protein